MHLTLHVLELRNLSGKTDEKIRKKSDKIWPVWGVGQVVYICIPIWDLLGVKGVTPER